MSIILDTNQAKAVHTLVIGVGEYPWLVGGSKPTFTEHSGMGQLTSAPVSARSFALWFLEEFSNPQLPGKSLEFLLSDAQSDTLTDSQGRVYQVERATMDNVKAAFGRWFARGNADPESMLLLYFCGHGIGKGVNTVLLMEDFGSLLGAQSLTLAVDFYQMHLGLDQCAARSQCFFIDACRVGTPFALKTLNYLGDPIFIPSLQTINPPRSSPIFYSAIPGAAAYGRTGEASFFTKALLNAFAGAGADDTYGAWCVDTHHLQSGIHHQLRRAVANTSAQGQLSVADGQSSPFTLHQLPTDPVVPVDVTCAPVHHNCNAQLSVLGIGPPQMYPAVAQGLWKLDLPLGKYRFDAVLPAPAVAQPRDADVRPPYRLVEMPVQ